VQYKIKIMNIYQNGEELIFENISIVRFESKFQEELKKLNNMELDFSSIQKLKGNKDLLELAFNAELKENI